MRVDKTIQYTVTMNLEEVRCIRDILDYTIRDTENDYWVNVATDFLYATRGGLKND